MNTYRRLEEAIDAIPLIDLHTHIDLAHQQARGLHDVLLYHMVASELYSAGCPDAERLPEYPDDAEAERRLVSAIPYVRHIRNTSCYGMMVSILRGLYGFDEALTEDNWRRADALIREQYAAGSAETIYNKANLANLCTEYCRKNGHESEMFSYSLEWAFFTRNQYGCFDAPVLELEVAASQEKPEGPMPVTMDRRIYEGVKPLTDVDEVDAAIKTYVEKVPFGEIFNTATHLSSDIRYADVTADEMNAALKNRGSAGRRERDIFANYINNAFLQRLSEVGQKISVSFSLGAEPLRYETGIKLSEDTIYAFEAMANRYPTIDFVLFNACPHQDDTVCSIIRETQNVYAAGFWWHSFFPSSIARMLAERVERLPLNKWYGYFSDAYCADWAYAKSRLVRGIYASVLAEKVDAGYYSVHNAEDIARTLLHDNAAALLKG